MGSAVMRRGAPRREDHADHTRAALGSNPSAGAFLDGWHSFHRQAFLCWQLRSTPVTTLSACG